MHALILLFINHQTKLEVPSVTIFEDIIWAIFYKKCHVTLTMPLLGEVCHL